MAEAYLGLAEHHNNDRENSHDPAVVASAKGILARLLSDNHTAHTAAELTIDDIISSIREQGAELSRDPRTGRPRPLLVTRDAIPVLERTLNGETMVALSAESGAQSVADEEVARVVWARSLHPRNHERKAQLQQAYFDALVDSWKPGFNSGQIMVCVQGRIMRLLGSLALNDFDPANWEMERVEDVRNEMVAAAKKAHKRAAAQLYEDRSLPDGVRSAIGGHLATTPAELRDIERRLGEASDEDEATARALLTEAMHEAIVALAKEVNERTPGAATDTMVEATKNDVAGAF